MLLRLQEVGVQVAEPKTLCLRPLLSCRPVPPTADMPCRTSCLPGPYTISPTCKYAMHDVLPEVPTPHLTLRIHPLLMYKPHWETQRSQAASAMRCCYVQCCPVIK